MQQIAHSQAVQPAPPSSMTLANVSGLSVSALAPPATDARAILQRADDVNTILRMLAEAKISTVVLTGDSGAGKSTLAALVYRQLQLAVGNTPFQQFVWLTLGPNATLPDCLAALLSSIDAATLPADFLLLKPDHQIALLFNTLSHPRSGAFVVLDQFEELLDPETAQGLPGRGSIALFLEMLQQNLGNSRVLCTNYRSPFAQQNSDGLRVRSYLVSRVSMPEGMGLLQQRGVQGSTPELSLVWQRCGGHIYALVLFCALFTFSGFSLSYLLNSPDYQFLWNGDVTLNLIGLVCNFLNPIQRTLLRALCLFSEPVPFDGLLLAITGDGSVADAQAYQRELAILLRFSIVQQMADETYQSCFLLHHAVRQYIREHYLEEHDHRIGGSLESAIGVVSEPNPMAANPEARNIGLAAGHMRVAAYYHRLASHQCPPRQHRQHLRDIEPLLQIIAHLCQGWHWQQAYDLLRAEGLHDNLMQWGACNTLIRLYMAMVPPLGVVTRIDEALICSHLGVLYGRLDDYQQSIHYYGQALATQREIHDLHGQAITLINQGELLRGRGDIQQARANFEQAYHILTQKPDARLQSVLLHNMGLLAQNEKKYPLALQNYLQSLKLAQSLREPYNAGMILTNMGMLFFEQRRLPEALALLQYARQVRQQAQDPAIDTLVRFLDTFEQKIGPEAFAQLQQEAHSKQSELLGG
ncbi:MAG TPA: tetratricopeptide repeat protein [Ktedonobacteraceae bacterium]|nr:tetratricopeptide repeat protein [Ktedonobacteraceae bacterium]